MRHSGWQPRARLETVSRTISGAFGPKKPFRIRVLSALATSKTTVRFSRPTAWKLPVGYRPGHDEEQPDGIAPTPAVCKALYFARKETFIDGTPPFRGELSLGTNRTMTLEQLRVFVAVADRQHVTRAAEALNLAQSAVSAAIAALEGRHGAKLFSRVGRGIELTEAGRLVPWRRQGRPGPGGVCRTRARRDSPASSGARSAFRRATRSPATGYRGGSSSIVVRIR